jgi:hypothetical protein
VDGIDNKEDGIIALTDTVEDIPRESDAVAWMPGRSRRFDIATANEGDLFGGSRGLSIFTPNGSVAFDSGTSFEEIAVRHGSEAALRTLYVLKTCRVSRPPPCAHMSAVDNVCCRRCCCRRLTSLHGDG